MCEVCNRITDFIRVNTNVNTVYNIVDGASVCLCPKAMFESQVLNHKTLELQTAAE